MRELGQTHDARERATAPAAMEPEGLAGQARGRQVLALASGVPAQAFVVVSVAGGHARDETRRPAAADQRRPIPPSAQFDDSVWHVWELEPGSSLGSPRSPWCAVVPEERAARGRGRVDVGVKRQTANVSERRRNRRVGRYNWNSAGCYPWPLVAAGGTHWPITGRHRVVPATAAQICKD